MLASIVQFDVSTHSRAKAAADFFLNLGKEFGGFNTQPREGGCTGTADNIADLLKFQHTAARRRLLETEESKQNFIAVSTHSRAEAAA